MQKLEAILSEYGVVIDNPEAVKASHALCAVLQELLGPKDYDNVMTLYSAVLFALCGSQEV